LLSLSFSVEATTAKPNIITPKKMHDKPNIRGCKAGPNIKAIPPAINPAAIKYSKLTIYFPLFSFSTASYFQSPIKKGAHIPSSNPLGKLVETATPLPCRSTTIDAVSSLLAS